MWNYAVVCLVGNLLCSGSANDVPAVSLLAMKMKGACPDPNIMQSYSENCTNSATVLESDADFAVDKRKFLKNDIIKVKKQNSILMLELINRAVYNSKVPRHQPMFGFEIINTIFAFHTKICPAIPASFLQTIHHLFSFLHWKTALDRKEYLPKKHQKWITKLITNCVSKVKIPKIRMDMCKETVVAVKNCSTFACTKKKHEFRLLRTDPILDVVFKSMELIQSVCFPVFKDSYRMFHYFHLAVMDTFTEEMKTRWATQLEDTSYWRRLLGPRFDTHLINLERCNEGIISRAKFHHRIDRSSLPARMRLVEAIQGMRK